VKSVKTHATRLDADLAKIALDASGIASIVVGVGADTECQKSGNVEQVGLVARLAKMSTHGIVGQQLDRAESIRDMNRLSLD
jgi:hypothetical protein